MDNPFQVELEVFFERITELQFILFQLGVLLTQDLERKKKALKNLSQDRHLTMSRLVISDITGKLDNGWRKAFATKHIKAIKYSDYESEVNDLISRESGIMVAQSSETFLRFLKNVTGIQLMHSANIATTIDPKFRNCVTKSEFLELVRKSKKLRKTENLFEALSLASNHFRRLSKDNNLGIDITDYYVVMSFIRHKVTHMQFKFKAHELKTWNPSLIKIQETYFPVEKDGDNFTIRLSRLQASHVLNTIAEIGFLIFKSVSITNNYEWDILDS